MFIRKSYIHQIKTLISKEKLLVILGARQAGKTSLLSLLQEDTDIQKQFSSLVYFNFEDIFGQKTFVNKQDFYDFIQTAIGADLKDKKTLILLDEVQEIQHIQDILKAVYDEKNYVATVIATGSWMWQVGEGGSSLVGRGAELTVYPFSFAEFVESKGLKFQRTTTISPSVQAIFNPLRQEFCTRGGYPAVVFANSQQEKITELGKILTRLIERDIAFRLTKQEVPVFEKVLQYLVRNTCNLLKYESVAQGTGISKKTLEKYLYILEKSQIIHYVYPFFQDKTKELTTHPKLYLGDLGLMTFLTKNYDLANDGRWIENSVFLELLKNKPHLHDEINIYKKLNASEIDFIYHSTAWELLPIEIKSGNGISIPKIFYSFADEYPQTKRFIKTTKGISAVKKLGKEKEVIFTPNWNVSNVL